MAKRKDKNLIVRMDEELFEASHEYAEKHGVSLGAIIRAVLRLLTNPDSPQELPPGVYEELKRSEYRPRKGKRRKKAGE